MTTLLSTERSTVHGITFPKNFKTEGLPVIERLMIGSPLF